MRLSSTTIFENGVTSMLSRQQELNKTQQHVATRRRVLPPSEDPVPSPQGLDLANDAYYLVHSVALHLKREAPSHPLSPLRSKKRESPP